MQAHDREHSSIGQTKEFTLSYIPKVYDSIDGGSLPKNSAGKSSNSVTNPFVNEEVGAPEQKTLPKIGAN
jgi:hypothetical protein